MTQSMFVVPVDSAGINEAFSCISLTLSIVRLVEKGSLGKRDLPEIRIGQRA